jgi:hypothetical protein
MRSFYSNLIHQFHPNITYMCSLYLSGNIRRLPFKNEMVIAACANICSLFPESGETHEGLCQKKLRDF